MKLVQLFLVFILFKRILCFKSLEHIETEVKIWRKIAFYSVNVLLNDESAEKGRVELGVLNFSDGKFQNLFEEIMKKSDRIVMEDLKTITAKYQRKDFIMILLKTRQFESAGTDFVYRRFSIEFPDKLTKFIVIIEHPNNESDKIEGNFCHQFQKTVSIRGFNNVLCLETNVNSVGIFKIQKTGDNFETVSIPLDHQTFPIFNGKPHTIQVLQYEVAPFSYISDGKLYGIEGKVLDEFCRKYGENDNDGDFRVGQWIF